MDNAITDEALAAFLHTLNMATSALHELWALLDGTYGPTLQQAGAALPDNTQVPFAKRRELFQVWLAQSGAKQQLGRFKSRRVRQLARVEGASGRADMEARELSRWRQELASLVVEANLPVLEPMLLVRNREVALMAALGNARAATIRKRVREWRKVLRNTVNQLTADLESKAPPRRKAPMLPVAIVGAMELAVSDASLPFYLRCFAFYKLVNHL
eukprot:s2501_g18.t1